MEYSVFLVSAYLACLWYCNKKLCEMLTVFYIISKVGKLGGGGVGGEDQSLLICCLCKKHLLNDLAVDFCILVVLQLHVSKKYFLFHCLTSPEFKSTLMVDKMINVLFIILIIVLH